MELLNPAVLSEVFEDVLSRSVEYVARRHDEPESDLIGVWGVADEDRDVDLGARLDSLPRLVPELIADQILNGLIHQSPFRTWRLLK